PSTFNFQPSTFNFQPATFNLQLIKASTYALKSARSLLEHPFDYPGVVVAITQVMVERREAMLLALLLHVVELLDLEFMIPDDSPVVRRRIHRETGRNSPIDSDDYVVLTGATVPGLDLAPHEVLHVIEPFNGIHHLVALAVLLYKPVDQSVDPGKIVRID